MYNQTKGYLEMKIMLKDVLKEMRERKQLKQSEVAEHVGVTAQTYMKWKTAKTNPRQATSKNLLKSYASAKAKYAEDKSSTAI
uniref:helix-turn-helix transcriptional regulator n=1 Tax=Vibrio cholerae TaxID=666 RepID=UPI003F580D3A